MSKVKRIPSPAEFIIRPKGFETDFPEDIPEGIPETELMKAFRADKYAALYEIGFKDPEDWYPVSLLYLRKVAAVFIKQVVDTEGIEDLRGEVTLDGSVDPMRAVGPPPFIPGAEHVNSAWVRGVWDLLMEVFRGQISEVDSSVELYFTEKNQDLHVPGKIFFHMVEDRHGDFPFAFMATYSPETGNTHLPLRYAMEEYRGDREKLMALLSSIDAVSSRSELIGSLVDSGEIMHPLGFSMDEAYTFLKEVPLYEECNIKCRIPNWWKNSTSNVSFSAVVGERGSGYIGLDTLLSFRPELSIDGIALSEEEIEDLLGRSEGLAFIKGKWVEVNKNRLKRTLDAFEKAKEYVNDGISMGDAFRMMFSREGQESTEGVMVEYGAWLTDFLKRMSDPDISEVQVPDWFDATLRPYQETGVAWISQLGKLGLGACLADDMGLGKTVQTLAYLSTRMDEGARALLVAPPSLLGNWVKEVERFAPRMTVDIIHGQDRSSGNGFLTITTYGMMAKLDWIRDTVWDVVILDEAQAIKNRMTGQAKAAKTLKGRFKVALTGTPVENGLWDLWSIFDFINPGLLGTPEYFKDIVTSEDDRVYSQLRNVTSPFILRRLKTDSEIISDLPEKNEIKRYVDLTKKQTVLYGKLADDLEKTLKHVEPRFRSALLLSSLSKFKQICNHPDQYLGTGDFQDRYSEKMQVMEQICETIRDKRERVLVFTQYREMTAPLADCLRKVFGREGAVIHGGVTPRERSRMVEKFNSQDNYVPFMVLSLKAGGVGLNLTGANHVIHFDRWWNPAVENQATDRAFRIGQEKDVNVYKLICKGTIEETIDQMIDGKMELANSVISSGETWLTRMSDEEIASLFTLRC